jgi:L-threonylcarbamoyladenylate synthase
MIDDALIAQAVAVLKAGGLVGMPTETVYGLAADASNAAAIGRIYAAKGRPSDHPVIVHLAHVEQIRDWAIDIPDEAWTMAKKFWSGPMTLILKRAPHVLDAVTGGQDTVGLRIPSHPVAHALLAAFGGGVAAPSANKFGRVSPTTAQHVKDEFGATVDLVLDGGASEVGIESTIIDCSGPVLRVLRPGAITTDMIDALLGKGDGVEIRHKTAAPRVSGSLDAHYAPRTQLVVVQAAELADTFLAHADKRLAVLSRVKPSAAFAGHWALAASEPAIYARELYSHLRDLDVVGADLILLEAPPRGPEWDGVNDRLRRAAFGSGDAQR